MNVVQSGELNKAGKLLGRDEEQVFQGQGVSPGIAFAYLRPVEDEAWERPSRYRISEGEVVLEQQRFERALAQTILELEQVAEELEEFSGQEESAIFEVHKLLLEDKNLISQVVKGIAERKQNAEYVFYAVVHNYAEAFRKTDDKFLLDKAADMVDIGARVLKNFTPDKEPHENLDELGDDIVLVAYDLTPSQAILIQKYPIKAFVSEEGSGTSHAAILAKTFDIPFVVGIENVYTHFKSFSFAIVDGDSGKVIVNPSEETVAVYRELQANKLKARAKLEKIREKKSETRDKVAVSLSANIEFKDDVEHVLESGAQGVGLLRSEFFLLQNQREMPDEEAQLEFYADAVSRLSPNCVTVRTLDAGGDKLPAVANLKKEANPFLGWRGVRVSLDHRDLFKQQVRAVLRASLVGQVKMMFPLISHWEQLVDCKQVVRECQKELSDEGVVLPYELPVGMMIEVPAAVMMVEEMADEVDFFSIGSNDLIQYTTAVDRGNAKVAHWYQSAHPAILRMIDKTVRAGDAAGISTSICGEMAGNLNLLPLVLGLGVNELSVSPNAILKVKAAIAALSMQDCQELAARALEMNDGESIYKMSKQMALEHYPDWLLV